MTIRPYISGMSLDRIRVHAKAAQAYYARDDGEGLERLDLRQAAHAGDDPEAAVVEPVADERAAADGRREIDRVAAEHLGRDAHRGEHRRGGDDRDRAGALGELHQARNEKGQDQDHDADRLTVRTDESAHGLLNPGDTQHGPEGAAARR